VEFEVDGDAVRIRRAPDHLQRRGRDIVGHMAGRGTVRMTTDELMALTRGEE
jgi:hypothetical protein